MFHSLAIVLVFLFVVAGVFLVPLGLPGTWLIVLAAVGYSIFYPFDGGGSSSIIVNAILIGLALFGEVAEFAVGTFGGKSFDVSTGAIVAAFVGGIIGAIVGVPVFLVGSVLGLFLGAFLGALLYELILLKSFPHALRNAGAVLATRIVATTLKTLLAVGMGVYLGFKIF